MLHMNTAEHALIVLIIIFAGGLIVGRLTEKPRIPDVAAYLLFGILVGPAGLNWISEPSGSQINQFVLYIGATLILFDGGRAIDFNILKRVWISITLLATIGVLVTALVVGVIAHFLLGAPWLFSLLLAGVMASTDPATLIPVFKRVPIIARLQQTVESESAFNDATASVLVFTLLTMMDSHGSFNVLAPTLQFFQSAGIGLLVGLLLGLLALWTVSVRGWGIFHEYGSIVLLVVALGSYLLAEYFHASGFMAAFTAGAVSGNGAVFRLKFAKHTEENVHHFGNAITLIMRMMIFVLLGTQVNFTVVFKYLGVGVVVVLALMFVARPLTVLSSVLVDRRAKWNWREIVFMFWVRETGVIPAALAGIVAADGNVQNADIIGAITFLAILVTILLQASTTGIVGKKLGLLARYEEEQV